MRAVKLLCFAICALAICVLVSILTQRLCFTGAERHVFFCGDTSKNCREVNCGNFPALKRLTLKEVCGESAFYSDLDIQKFLKSVGGKVVFEETLSDSVNYYCSADLPYSVNLYGAEINLQICVKNEGVTVASPIIFGGY